MDLEPDTTICVVCICGNFWTLKRPVKLIQCENKCERWCHTSCMGISDVDYSKLSSTNKNKWVCNHVNCLSSSQHPSNLLFNCFDDLSDKNE